FHDVKFQRAVHILVGAIADLRGIGAEAEGAKVAVGHEGGIELDGRPGVVHVYRIEFADVDDILVRHVADRCAVGTESIVVGYVAVRDERGVHLDRHTGRGNLGQVQLHLALGIQIRVIQDHAPVRTEADSGTDITVLRKVGIEPGRRTRARQVDQVQFELVEHVLVRDVRYLRSVRTEDKLVHDAARRYGAIQLDRSTRFREVNDIQLAFRCRILECEISDVSTIRTQGKGAYLATGNEWRIYLDRLARRCRVYQFEAN